MLSFKKNKNHPFPIIRETQFAASAIERLKLRVSIN